MFVQTCAFPLGWNRIYTTHLYDTPICITMLLQEYEGSRVFGALTFFYWPRFWNSGCLCCMCQSAPCVRRCSCILSTMWLRRAPSSLWRTKLDCPTLLIRTWTMGYANLGAIFNYLLADLVGSIRTEGTVWNGKRRFSEAGDPQITTTWPWLRNIAFLCPHCDWFKCDLAISLRRLQFLLRLGGSLRLGGPGKVICVDETFTTKRRSTRGAIVGGAREDCSAKGPLSNTPIKSGIQLAHARF